METQSMRVTQGGRLVLPSFVRKIFNIHAGGRLNVQIVEGEIRLQPRQEALRRIQALVRHRIPKGQSIGALNLNFMQHYHCTTIVSVRRGAQVALGGDGQVTLGHVVVKGGARKVRRIYHDKVLAGFAGGTADAFSLLDRFEGKLEKYQGHLMRAAVELAKDWRTDRMLRRLEAMLIVANVETTLVLTGNGDVHDAEDSICAIGSGGAYAQAAARALAHNTELRPREIVDKSLEIAAELCIYTNQNRVIETLD